MRKASRQMNEILISIVERKKKKKHVTWCTNVPEWPVVTIHQSRLVSPAGERRHWRENNTRENCGRKKCLIFVCDCTQKASLGADESEMKNGFIIKVIKVHQKHDSGCFFHPPSVVLLKKCSTFATNALQFKTPLMETVLIRLLLG